MDIIWLAVVAGFFAGSFALVRLFTGLQEET
jgi:hypothetical protein